MSWVPRGAAEPPLILSIDVGTSSVRVLLFDRRGRSVDGVQGRSETVIRTTPDGGADIDAEDLRARVEQTVDQALAVAGDLAGSIGAVATCTFWHSVMGVDAAGNAATPVYTWVDTRSTAAAEELRRRLDEREVHQRTGCVLHPSYVPAKILWISKIQPSRVLLRWMSFGEYLYVRLFGRTAASLSMASATGLFDRRARTWDVELLRAIGIRPDQLSPLTDVGDPFRGLREPYDKRWPALRDVPWIPAVGDGGCNSIGSGCVNDRRIAVMIGTSGALRVTRSADPYPLPRGLFAYHIDRRRTVTGGALSDGGNVLDWVRETFSIDSESAVGRMEPDAHGLTVLPFLGGERSPGWASDARGWIGGLRLSTRPGDILRAVMEAVACRFALIRELAAPAAPEAREVVASGGALLRSPVWMQILADVLDCPVTASAEPEASSRGAAILALEALGAITPLEELAFSFGVTFMPVAGRHEIYRGAIERQRRAYDALIARVQDGRSPST